MRSHEVTWGHMTSSQLCTTGYPAAACTNGFTVHSTLYCVWARTATQAHTITMWTFHYTCTHACTHARTHAHMHIEREYLPVKWGLLNEHFHCVEQQQRWGPESTHRVDHAAAELSGLWERPQQVDDLGCEAKWNQFRKGKKLEVGAKLQCKYTVFESHCCTLQGYSTTPCKSHRENSISQWLVQCTTNCTSLAHMGKLNINVQSQ